MMNKMNKKNKKRKDEMMSQIRNQTADSMADSTTPYATSPLQMNLLPILNHASTLFLIPPIFTHRRTISPCPK